MSESVILDSSLLEIQTFPPSKRQNVSLISNLPSTRAPNNRKLKILCLSIFIVCCLVTVAIISTIIGVLISKQNSQNKKFTLNPECGIRWPQDKIVGGHEASKNSWPSIALIVFNYYFIYNQNGVLTKGVKTKTCGGSLINRKTILTAAHCFQKTISYPEAGKITVEINSFHPTIGSMYTVYLGTNDITGAHELNEPVAGEKVGVSSFIIHPDYEVNTNLNDIGIIKLDREVNIGTNIQTACLPEPEFGVYPSDTDITGYIAGWGLLNQSSPMIPKKLNEAEIQIYDGSMCSLVFPFIEKDWDRQICAGNYTGGVDSCQGDSGGPLVVKDNLNGKEKFILVGLTSYGQGCAQAEKPGIYTRVSSYLDWISKNS